MLELIPILIIGFVAVIGIIFGCGYLPKCIALKRMAAACTIKRPWLAFLPLGDVWIFGALADLYDQNKGTVSRRRWSLLVAPYWMILLLIAALTGLPLDITTYIMTATGAPENSKTLICIILYGVITIAVLALTVLQIIRSTNALRPVCRLFEPDKAEARYSLIITLSSVGAAVTMFFPYIGWIVGLPLLLGSKSFVLLKISKNPPDLGSPP